MHASIFDPYQPRTSLFHKLDARGKVLVAFSLIISTVLLPEGAWLGFASTWILILYATHLAEIDFRYLLSRSLIYLPFVLAAASVLVTVPGSSVVDISIFNQTIQITTQGIQRFTSIILKSWLSVQVAILLVATTQFPDLIHALGHLKIPKVLVGTLSFMYRYMFVLIDEVLRLIRARRARSAALEGYQSGGKISWRARSAGNMAGQLFTRSYERSDRVYNAMLARGFQGELLTLTPHQMGDRDWNFLLLGVLLTLCIQLLTYTVGLPIQV